MEPSIIVVPRLTRRSAGDTLRSMWRASAFLFLLLAIALPIFADDNGHEDRIRFGTAIVIEPGQSTGDVICIACPIINRGAVEGDAVVIMGSIENRGSISGDGVVVMGPLHNYSAIGGDVAVVAGALDLGPNASVGKDADIVMGSLNMASGSVVHGTIDRSMAHGSAIALLFFVPLTLGIVLAIVLGLICYSIAGQTRIAVVADTVRRKPGLTFVSGIGACVAFVFALWAFAHMRPLSGLLVIAASIAITVALIVGYTGLSFAIGTRLRQTSPVTAVVIGAIVIAVAQAIPVLQIFFGFALMMFALGAAALTGFGTHPDWIESRFAGPPSSAR